MTLANMLLLVSPLVFFASFVDSIAGGGGLISLPAYLATGIPTHMAFGSNKLSASVGSLTAIIKYRKSKRIDFKAAGISAVLALAGAFAGTKLNLAIDASVMKKIVIVAIPFVAVFALLFDAKKHRREPQHGAELYLTCAAIGFVVGIYDGLIGPGTGTFLILGFTAISGFDYVTASGNAKVVNFASNIASLFVFLVDGSVYFSLAVPAALCGIAGGWLGSSFAVKNGKRVVKTMMLFVLVGILIKLVADLL